MRKQIAIVLLSLLPGFFIATKAQDSGIRDVVTLKNGNGVLLRNGEKYLHYGEQVLLAGNIALPWNKVQQLLQANDGGGGYGGDNSYSQQEEKEIPYCNGTGLIIFGYLFAILGGLLGLIFGLILLNSTMIVNGKRVKKYKPSARTNGAVIVGIFCAMVVVSVIYLLRLPTFNFQFSTEKLLSLRRF
ncbi:hypothetical protein FACS189435_2720 [Bacteroidia bacterium]|nr:hypothetical protein FACS189435_2720 [Bacteroidia bacterium]